MAVGAVGVAQGHSPTGSLRAFFSYRLEFSSVSLFPNNVSLITYRHICIFLIIIYDDGF